MNKNIYLAMMFILGCTILYFGFTRGASDERKFKEFIHNKRSFSSLLSSSVSEVEGEYKLTYLSNDYKKSKVDSCQQFNGTLGLISREIKSTVDQIESISHQLTHLDLAIEENTFIDTYFYYAKYKNSEIESPWFVNWTPLSEDKKKCKESLVTASNILYSLIRGRSLNDMKSYLGHHDLIHKKKENTLQSFRFIFIFDDSNALLDYYFVSSDSMLLAYRKVINH